MPVYTVRQMRILFASKSKVQSSALAGFLKTKVLKIIFSKVPSKNNCDWRRESSPDVLPWRPQDHVTECARDAGRRVGGAAASQRLLVATEATPVRHEVAQRGGLRRVEIVRELHQAPPRRVDILYPWNRNEATDSKCTEPPGSRFAGFLGA